MKYEATHFSLSTSDRLVVEFSRDEWLHVASIL